MKLCNLFFRSLLCGALSLAMVGGCLSVSAYTGSAPQQKTEGTNLRVMSYNVLVDNDESLGGWSWGQPLGTRGDKASACINYYKPDVIGFQECNYKWHVSLRANLPDYDFVNADVPEVQYLEKAESLGKKDWMCTTMMYNTKTLKLIKNELIGYSVNYWGCIQRMRYASTAVFEIKATGERFTFISTHLDAEQAEKGQQMRMIQTDELAEVINRYKSTYGYPVIATGDYNSKFSDAPIQNVVQKAGMTSDTRNRGGIDYILYSAGIESKYFTVVGDSDVLGASDHKPVFADMQVQKYAFPTTKETTTTTTTQTTTTTTTRATAAVITKPTTTTAGQTTASTTQGSGVAIQKPQSTTTSQAAAPGQSVGSTAPGVGDTTAKTEALTTTGGDTTGAQATQSTDPVSGQPGVTEEADPTSTDAATTATQAENVGGEIIQEFADQQTSDNLPEEREKSNGVSPWIPVAGIAGGVLLVGGVLAAAYFIINKKKN